MIKLKNVIIIFMFLCFFISIAGVSAIDDSDMENVTMVEEESELDASNTIETITDLDSEIQNATSNSTVYIKNDIIINEDSECKGIEISKRMTIDGQGHKIDGNSSGAPFS